jgi:putative transposase
VAVVRRAYRFALDPSPAQERSLRSHAGAARFAWNWALAKCRERYTREAKWYSAAEMHKLWNTQKKADPALGWWTENSCDGCGLVADRDVNAARNLLSLAASGAESLNAREGTPRPCPARQVPPNLEPGTPPGGKTGTATPQGTAAA